MKVYNDFFEGLAPFNMSLKYLELNSQTHTNGIDSHVHSECEVYINLSGNVSIAVEDRIYPVKRGDVIITRPFEYHHCIYHSNELHRHFWILFSSKGNEDLFDLFFKRNPGEGNLLVLPSDDRETLIELCRSMLEKQAPRYKKFYNFFSMINLLNSAESTSEVEKDYPRDITLALDYISRNFTYSMSVSDISKAANVSVNTLERHFWAHLGSSPSQYVRKKRLANAVKLLSSGATVTEASDNSGFPDYSAFIALFKKTYGITPLQYKKKLNK